MLRFAMKEEPAVRGLFLSNSRAAPIYGKQMDILTSSVAECPSVSDTVIVVPGPPLVVVTLVTVKAPVDVVGATVAILVFVLTAVKLPL